MTQNNAHPSGSPLIAPTACSLILLAPSSPDLRAITRQTRTNIRRNFVRVISAANIVDVVPLVCSPCDKPGRPAFASHLADLRHREFVTGALGSRWQHPPLRDTLAVEDRPALVL